MSFAECLFSRHLEFPKQRKIKERNKLPLSGLARNGSDEGGGGSSNRFSDEAWLCFPRSPN